MLKGIDPALTPDLLHTLASMGHGDTIALVDANFPAASVAADTVLGEPLTLTLDVVAALRAILTVLPIDTFDGDPVHTMQVVGDERAVPPVVAALRDLTGDSAALPRQAFYALARQAFAVVATTETRLYGNVIVRKGIVAPD